MDITKLNAAQQAAYAKLTPEQQTAFAALPDDQFALMMTKLSDIIDQTKVQTFFVSFDEANVAALNQLLKNAYDGLVAALNVTQAQDMIKCANIVKQHYSDILRQQVLYIPPAPLTAAQVAALAQNTTK